jgi:Peptidase family M28
MRFFWTLALTTVAAAQQLETKTLDEDALRGLLKQAIAGNAERYVRLKTLLDRSGCRGDIYKEQIVKGSSEPNMICTVAGTGASPHKIIVGAHFDSRGGDGIIDNWSGAVLLPVFAQSLRERPRRHNFEFVAFAAEEKGLRGSRVYVKSIPKQDRTQIAAVIAIDSLGMTPTKYWPFGSTEQLVSAAIGIGQWLKLEISGFNLNGLGTTDSQVFMDAHIPVLSLHSVTRPTWKIINGRRDVWSAVSWKDYYDSYRLISALLFYLDETLP